MPTEAEKAEAKKQEQEELAQRRERFHGELQEKAKTLVQHSDQQAHDIGVWLLGYVAGAFEQSEQDVPPMSSVNVTNCTVEGGGISAGVPEPIGVSRTPIGVPGTTKLMGRTHFDPSDIADDILDDDDVAKGVMKSFSDTIAKDFSDAIAKDIDEKIMGDTECTCRVGVDGVSAHGCPLHDISTEGK